MLSHFEDTGSYVTYYLFFNPEFRRIPLIHPAGHNWNCTLGNWALGPEEILTDKSLPAQL